MFFLFKTKLQNLHVVSLGFDLGIFWLLVSMVWVVLVETSMSWLSEGVMSVGDKASVLGGVKELDEAVALGASMGKDLWLTEALRSTVGAVEEPEAADGPAERFEASEALHGADKLAAVDCLGSVQVLRVSKGLGPERGVEAIKRITGEPAIVAFGPTKLRAAGGLGTERATAGFVVGRWAADGPHLRTWLTNKFVRIIIRWQ